MTNEFIPYNQALALKELGFDEPCLAYWNIDPQLKNPTFNMVKPFEHEWCLPSPMFSQAFRFFREKYKLHSGIYPYYDEYEFQIKDFRLPTNTPINGGLMPYEEAELACLRKLIEIVKQK